MDNKKHCPVMDKPCIGEGCAWANGSGACSMVPVSVELAETIVYEGEIVSTEDDDEHLSAMRNLVKLQKQSLTGILSYEQEYLRGMYNGLELALAVLENREPIYADAPAESHSEAPVSSGDELCDSCAKQCSVEMKYDVETGKTISCDGYVPNPCASCTMDIENCKSCPSVAQKKYPPIEG